MSLFVVVREAGPGWADGGISEQPGVAEHGAFMSSLAEEGLLLFGGPLAGTETGRVRALLILVADSKTAILERLADDPWVSTRQLVTRSVEPWLILAGSEVLRAAAR